MRGLGHADLSTAPRGAPRVESLSAGRRLEVAGGL